MNSNAVVFAVCLSMLITLFLAGPSEASTAEISGQVLDATSVAVAGLPISVLLEESPEYAAATGNTETIEMLPLDNTTTDALGRFAFEAVPPDDMTPYLRDNGSVTLMIGALTDPYDVIQHYVAYPPADASSPWVWESEATAANEDVNAVAVSEPDFLLEDGLGGNDDLSGVEDTAIVSTAPLTEPMSGLVVLAASEGASDDPELSTTAALVDGEAAVCGYGWYWLRGTATERRNIPIFRAYTLYQSTMRFDWETTNSTKMSIAVAGTKGSYKGGLTYSRQQDMSAGVNPTFVNETHQVFKAEWEYHRYNLYCRDSISDATGRYSGRYEYRPDFWTLGSNRVSGGNIWNCQSTAHRVRITAPTWVAKTLSTTWGGFFSIADVRLDANQANNQTHRVRLFPDTSNGARICGRGDVPSRAAQVKEMI